MKVLSAEENVRNSHTTGFSRVVLQLQARGAAGLVTLLDTTDFSRVVFQFRPSAVVQS